MKKKLKKKDIEDIAIVRAALVSALGELGEMSSHVAMAALIETTMDTAILLAGMDKEKAVACVSEMINVLMLRKY
jgi:hypothetical protein